jgi:hypothetical protein
VGGKRDLKPSSSDEPNKRIMSRLKAAQSSGKGTTGEKSQAGKDNAKRAAKRSRKRRRAQDDSRSTSQDKNSTIMPGKQIKITKDKHFLNPNISKMIRKSINDCSHGQEKTVKIGSKNKEKQALEEKKKQLDTFNETIRKNNLRSMQNSKEMRGDSLAASHVNLSSNAAGSPTNPMSNYAKKLNKIMKCKKESDDTHHPKEIGHNSHAEKSSPNKQSVIHVDREVNLKKKASGSVRENPSQNHVSLVPFEPADLKKGPQITFKKVESAVTPKLNSHLQPPNPGESRERTREKSGDERKSSEDMKKKGKGRTRKDPKKERALNAGDDKIKENLQKVNNKAKLAIKHQAKAILKRFNKPRRSKSSIDLMSDQILKQMLGRSDSVNIKPGKTVDQLLQEYKNIVGKDKKGAHPRDATLKDRILKKGFKEKVPIAKQPSNRPIKLKQSKSSKVYKRFESFPMKMKKLTALTSTVPINQLTSHLKHTHASDKSKEREILDTINQMNSKIQKNYDVGPSLGLKSKMPVGTNHGLYMPATTGTKKSKKPKAKGSKKKVNIEQEAGSEDIPVEEKELIDKEILMPKSSSDYANGIYGSKIDKDQLKIDSFVPNNHTEPKKNPLADDNSPKSMRIRDSESSDRENSEKSVHYKPAPDEIDDEDRYSDRDHLNETPRYSQGDLFSKENFDKWMYLLQEFKNCQKNGNVDGELKELLINFCDKTQKGITQLIEEVHQGKRGQIYSDQKPSAHQRDSPTEDDLKRRKKPHLGIDVEKINDEFVKNSSNIQIKDNRSNSFQWLKAEFEQNLQELAKLLGNNKDVTIKKIQVGDYHLGSNETQ